MSRPVLVGLVVVVCGLLTAGAFWLLDLLLGDMWHPLWGFVGGVAVALFSYVRTGWSDRRDRRRLG